VDIPGSDVNEGHVLTQYVGPAPPKGTGLHRYVFVLYKQQMAFGKHTPELEGRRGGWKLRCWARENNLGMFLAHLDSGWVTVLKKSDFSCR
jgi:hypothetical protein